MKRLAVAVLFLFLSGAAIAGPVVGFGFTGASPGEFGMSPMIGWKVGESFSIEASYVNPGEVVYEQSNGPGATSAHRVLADAFRVSFVGRSDPMKWGLRLVGGVSVYSVSAKAEDSVTSVTVEERQGRKPSVTKVATNLSSSQEKKSYTTPGFLLGIERDLTPRTALRLTYEIVTGKSSAFSSGGVPDTDVLYLGAVSRF